jgi:branched-subunit amino acid aminotransferase/4-amino-4-deoxychorismate lyase
MVIANPVEIYSSGPMRVLIERNDVRAMVGGVGAAKAAANYAASLRATTADGLLICFAGRAPFPTGRRQAE